MSDVGRARCRRLMRPVVAVALLSSFALGCGRAEQVRVVAAPLPVSTPPAISALPAPTSSFQGAVTSFDRAAGHLTVAVQIVWTPVLKAERHDREVVVGPDTLWDPSTAATDVLIGDEVQVEAEDAVDGRWPAVRVQLLDID